MFVYIFLPLVVTRGFPLRHCRRVLTAQCRQKLTHLRQEPALRMPGAGRRRPAGSGRPPRAPSQQTGLTSPGENGPWPLDTAASARERARERESINRTGSPPTPLDRPPGTPLASDRPIELRYGESPGSRYRHAGLSALSLMFLNDDTGLLLPGCERANTD